MVFKPKISLSDKDIREEESVDFVRDLLKGYGVKPSLKKGDKEANIDGYIELLDEENRINGKITAQVKTVPPSLEGQNLYDCPTSLFGYAEQTTEIVLIMAVDHKNKKVLWKYISRDLIDANSGKSNQDTIRLHFNQDGQMTVENVEDTIRIWRNLARQQLKLYNDAPALAQEIEELRKALLEAKGIDITLPKKDFQIVQKFIDDYNDLMNKELSFVKQNLYPDVWKFGIAIYCYEPTKLGYLIYSINNGENSPLIKQMPPNFALLQQMPYEVMTNYNYDNPFITDYKILLRSRIKDHLEKFVKHYTELPMTVPFAMEMVANYLKNDAGGLIVPKEERKSFSAIAQWLQTFAPKLLRPRTRVVYGYFHEVDLFAVYNSLQYLVSQGIESVTITYPPKGKYGNTGYVYDWYNAETAFIKAKYVLEAVEAAYRSFITNNFPLIAGKLDYYKEADLVALNVRYEQQHGIEFYYLYSGRQLPRRFLFSLNGNNELMKEIEQTPYADRHKRVYKVGNIDYNLKSFGWGAADETLFSNTPLKDTYHKMIISSFEHLEEKLIF